MAPSSDPLADFRKETVRGSPGHFRVAQTHAGPWWFIDPANRPFFARAVHGVSAAAEASHDPTARLRAWGFNALGCDSDRLHADEGLAFLATVDFCASGAPVQLAGVRLPDVFDPAWPAQARIRAAGVCGPLAENRAVLGWVTDDGAGWAARPAVERPGLLQVCLSLEPSLAAYHAAWEFVLALHGGRLETMARDWGVTLANKEALRTLTRQDQGIVTRGYWRDDEHWSGEFAQRYFAATTAAIREYAPQHLVLGCRWRGPANPTLLAKAAAAADICLLDSSELPAAAVAPVMLGDFSCARESFRAVGSGRHAWGPTAVERMLRRGRQTLVRAVAHPAVVGYAWSRWQDRPGEQPPFGGGLVHCNEIEAREHTELLTAINDRVEELRAMAMIPEEIT